jgi:hypothetical protein
MRLLYSEYGERRNAKRRGKPPKMANYATDRYIPEVAEDNRWPNRRRRPTKVGFTREELWGSEDTMIALLDGGVEQPDESWLDAMKEVESIPLDSSRARIFYRRLDYTTESSIAQYSRGTRRVGL